MSALANTANKCVFTNITIPSLRTRSTIKAISKEVVKPCWIIEQVANSVAFTSFLLIIPVKTLVLFSTVFNHATPAAQFGYRLTTDEA